MSDADFLSLSRRFAEAVKKMEKAKEEHLRLSHELQRAATVMNDAVGYAERVQGELIRAAKGLGAVQAKEVEAKPFPPVVNAGPVQTLKPAKAKG